MTTHEKYMRHCVELARKGAGQVAPNPMVGSVIVHNGHIIGEGYHQKYGEAHAEVNAINSVADKSLLAHSTIYVTLEPCSHYGKTPPCALKIIECGIPRVVIGHNDPFPKVMGGGVKMLRENGIEVIENVLYNECAWLNRRFFTFHEKKRPYVMLKWAQTADDFIDNMRTDATLHALKISTPETTRLLHCVRSEESAIMVGTNTALLDNPSLTVRYCEGNNPVRVVLDKDLIIPPEYKLFNGEAKTIVFTEKNAVSAQNVQYVNINFDKNVLEQVLDELYRQNLLSLLIEGGAELLNSVIVSDLWDEARVETAENLYITTGVKAPGLRNEKFMTEENFDNNIIRYYKNKHGY